MQVYKVNNTIKKNVAIKQEEDDKYKQNGIYALQYEVINAMKYIWRPRNHCTPM
jgi:hypothetical protein